MSIPNYLYALANHKGPATVTAGGMTIPVKIMDIEHESKWGESDKCTFKCLVVNEDQILSSGVKVDDILVRACANMAKNALNSVYGTRCKKAANPFEIKKVYFNDPVTVVIWADGTKTIVRCQEGDVYSKETGLALCIAKKALGNKGNFNDVFHKWIPEEEETSDFSTNTAFNEALAKLTEAAVKAGSAIKECAIYDTNR
jgi:hypothetical protein